jgi:hypothetical protein
MLSPTNVPEEPNFQTYATRWLANFEEDGNLSTATSNILTIGTSRVTRWSEVWHRLKDDEMDSHVMALAWDDRFGEDAEFRLEFTSPIDLNGYTGLVFAAARNAGSTLPNTFAESEPGDADEGASGEDEGFEPLDWSIELEDSDGNLAHLLLSDVEPLYSQIKSNTRRAQYSYTDPESEAIMKYFSFALDEFIYAGSSFDRSRVSEIRFHFDQSARGSILLDDIGLQ